LAYADEVNHEYGITLTKKENLSKADVLIIAVAHQEFGDLLRGENLFNFVNPGALVFDFKKLLKKEEVEKCGCEYFTL